MVITLKIISCVVNYQDGLLKENDLREAQKQNRLLKLPSLFEYIGFCLCCGSHFAGPVYEMKAYLEWTERKGVCEQCCFLIYIFLFFLKLISSQLINKWYYCIILVRSGSLQTKNDHCHHLLCQP